MCRVLVSSSGAVRLDDLDTDVVLLVSDVTIEGHETCWARTLSGKISTSARPWYTRWRDRPELEPFTLENDLEQAYILAVLLFGRPISNLSAGEQSSLGDSGGDIFWRKRY